ncbi:MAG: peroxidase family protein [Myxococcota bacterium]|nr:peroxidase family protein [Myxococcota bacterium]
MQSPPSRARWSVPAAFLLVAFGCGPYRSIDGTGNNPRHPERGAAGQPLHRALASHYGDGVESMAGQHKPSPRVISNEVCDQQGSRPNAHRASDFVWQWGQFLDHDIDLTPEAEPLEPAPIPVPAGDPFFDPGGTGGVGIGFHRSIWHPDTASGPANPRQQKNEITSFIDASNVYGSDAARAAALRKNDGSGELATSPGDLLPWNTGGFPNAGGDDDSLFLAGDVRANEQVGLTALHTLFVREHNRIARIVRSQLPTWSGDRVYQAARQLVGAEMQAITFREYLPALLGRFAPSVKSVYRPRVQPQIVNHFSTALFRYGHSQLNPLLLRLDEAGNEIAAGNLRLRDAFFAPDEVVDHGIEPLLRGLASQQAQAVDPFVIDDVRNFLFGPPGSGGFDLASLNIQRGRDHGLPAYNATRLGYGLPPAANYDDISSDPEIQARLEAAYGAGNVDDVDLWVGALAEDPLPGALVGPLIGKAIRKQFVRLRDGDRFWYRRTLPRVLVLMVESTTLADVIRANTSITSIQDDVFHVTRP